MNIDYSEYILSKKEKTDFLVAGYMGTFAVFFLFYHSIILSLTAGILTIFMLNSYRAFLAKRRKDLLLTQFKDLLYSLSASITTGRQMPEALGDALENLSLIYDGNSPMIRELRYMVRNISENRENDEQLLLQFAKRSDCEDIRNFVEVYMTCRKMGGNLDKVLKNTAEILVDKMTIEREIKALTAQKRLEGKIITIMPLAVIICLNLFSPDYLNVLYTTFAGRIIMTAAMLGIAGAYYMTEKLTKIEV